MTRTKLADLLEGFVNGTCGDWEWDDFLSVPHDDPEIEKIHERCEQLVGCRISPDKARAVL
jgi:hypothetical protein